MRKVREIPGMPQSGDLSMKKVREIPAMSWRRFLKYFIPIVAPPTSFSPGIFHSNYCSTLFSPGIFFSQKNEFFIPIFFLSTSFPLGIFLPEKGMFC